MRRPLLFSLCSRSSGTKSTAENDYDTIIQDLTHTADSMVLRTTGVVVANLERVDQTFDCWQVQAGVGFSGPLLKLGL